MAQGSLRASALVLAFISRLLGREPQVPSPTSVRSRLLRVGLYQLQRPLEIADDWVRIVDPTVQIGEFKCLLMVGFRLEESQRREVRTLAYSDVDLLGLWPARNSVAWIYDIKHKTASLLKAELQHDPQWTAFAARANVTKRQVYLTKLAFSNPPQQRGKARYMSIDRLSHWGCELLRWLDKPRSIGREPTAQGVAEKLGWLRHYRESLQKWAQAMQVIETVETMVRLEGYRAGSAAEFRERLPALEPDSLAARLRDDLLELTRSVIRKALTTITTATLRQWEQTHLGSTIQRHPGGELPRGCGCPGTGRC